MKKYIIPIIVIIALGIGVSVYVPHAPSSDNTAVRTQVESFGHELQNVSLLAPSTTLETEMQSAYSAYVAPELLDTWQADPSQALGRQTSNPYPDSISISSITKQDDTTYRAEGTVREITSMNEVTDTYPVTLTLEKRGDTWLITSVTKGTYQKI